MQMGVMDRKEKIATRLRRKMVTSTNRRGRQADREADRERDTTKQRARERGRDREKEREREGGGGKERYRQTYRDRDRDRLKDRQNVPTHTNRKHVAIIENLHTYILFNSRSTLANCQ